MSLYQTYVLYSSIAGQMYGSWLLPITFFLFLFLMMDLIFGKNVTRTIRALKLKSIGGKKKVGILKQNKFGDTDIELATENANVLIAKNKNTWDIYSTKDKMNLGGITLLNVLSDYASTVPADVAKAAEILKDLGIKDLNKLEDFFYIHSKKDADGKYTEYKIPLSQLYLRPRELKEIIEIEPSATDRAIAKIFKKPEWAKVQKIKVSFPDVGVGYANLRNFVINFTPEGMNNLIQRKAAEMNARRIKGTDVKFLVYAGFGVMLALVGVNFLMKNYIPLEACQGLGAVSKNALASAVGIK